MTTQPLLVFRAIEEAVVDENEKMADVLDEEEADVAISSLSLLFQLA